MSLLSDETKGVQAPRICTLPDGIVSTGSADDAIELAAITGLVLDPWQETVLRGAFAEDLNGDWAAKQIALIVARQNGKGSILEAAEIAYLFLFGSRYILHSAHEFKTAKIAYRRVSELIRNTPDLHSRVRAYRHSNDDVSIELDNGSILRFVARSTGSSRGFTADVVILDESYNLTQDALAAMLPTTLAVKNSQIWFTSSAGMETSEALAAIRERGRTGWPGLAYFEWSAPEGSSLDDVSAWAAANPGLGIRIKPVDIETMRGILDERSFAREHLGIWHDPGTETVIDIALWNELADRNSQAVGTVAFALDVAPDRSSASIAVAGRRADDMLHVEVTDNRKGVGWVVPQIAAMYGATQPIAVMLDASGPAGSLIPELERAGVELKITSGREMGQACGSFYDAVIEKRLKHVDGTALNTALGTAKQRPLGDAWAWHRKDSNVDITPLVASTLALYAFTSTPPPKRKYLVAGF